MNDRSFRKRGANVRVFYYLQIIISLFSPGMTDHADWQENNFHFLFPFFPGTFIWQAFLDAKTVEK
jgi:hypothetical protein